MKKYLNLQLKRSFRIIPIVLIISAILLSGILLIMGNLLSDQNKKTEPFKIGITGDTEADYLKTAVSALTTFDTSRFSMQLVIMDETDAKSALEKRQISAYAVFPEDFIRRAIDGDVQEIRFVTTTGSTDVLSIFKNELTKIITSLVAESQKGVYGISDALDQNGYENISHKKMNELNIEYIELILHRSKLYNVETLGISNGLSMSQYYLGSFIMLFLVFLTIPYGIIFIKKDYSLNRILCSKQLNSKKQIFSEYLAFLISFATIPFLALSILGIYLATFPAISNTFGEISVLELGITLIPVIIVITALAFLIFEISDDIISGLLLHFFISFFLSYISGLIFPIYSLPMILQKVSRFFPIGLCRIFTEGYFVYDTDFVTLIGIIAYAILFIIISIFVRNYKIINDKG